MDLVKIVVAGSLASEFFAAFPWILRATIVLVTLLLFLMALLFQPSNPERGKE